jgi:hypothetical protein
VGVVLLQVGLLDEAVIRDFGAFGAWRYNILESLVLSMEGRPARGREALLPVLLYLRRVLRTHWDVTLNSAASSVVDAPASYFEIILLRVLVDSSLSGRRFALISVPNERCGGML